MSDGLWVHQIPRSGGGQAIVSAAKQIGAKHVIVKARDGLSSYRKNRGLISPLALVARVAGVDTWLWTWARPYAPLKGMEYVIDQAKLLAQDAHEHGARVVVANMEAPWSWSKLGGGAFLGEKELRRRAYQYVCTLREALPKNCQIGISSFRYPKWHKLPWSQMLGVVEVIGMPQIYFQRKGYDEQARQSRLAWSSYGVSSIRISGPGYTWRKGKIDPVAFASEARRHSSGIDWWKSDGMKPEDLAALAEQ